MAFNVGLNVVEVDGSATPAIVGAAVSVAGFNITTERGVSNLPTRITQFSQFVDRFGGFFAGGLGPYLVKGFFENGGQTAYVNRVVSTDPISGALTARRELDDSRGAGARPSLRLEAGYRGRPDPGAWGNRVFVRLRASASAQTRLRERSAATIRGGALADATDMSAAPPLAIRVDGEPEAREIVFQTGDFAAPAAATRTEIRDAINRRVTYLEASVTPENRLALTSTREVAIRRDDWSSLQVTEAHVALGFSAMANPTRGPLVNLTAGGATLASTEGFAVGDALVLRDGTRTAFTKLMRVGADGAVEWSPAVATPATFDDRLLRVETAEFDLDLAVGQGDEEHVVETWAGLSMERDTGNYAPTLLNDPLRGSRLLLATDLRSDAGAGATRPAPSGAFVPLGARAGVDGVPLAQQFAGDSAQHTGFFAFDPVEIQLLACERTDRAVVEAALGYCASRGDCMFVGSVPEGTVGSEAAEAYGKDLQGNKVYGALYGPWIKVLDPLATGTNPYRWVPPQGHVMGIYARIESSRGIWKAPAGDEARVLGALDVEHQLSDADHTILVKSGSVNGIRAIPGAGIVVDASRTLSTDTRWLYVNVRLLFNYVKTSLKQGLRWVRQEPNRDTLWTSVKHGTVVPFLSGLWRRGAFGTGKPDEVFTVVCDASNNPPEEVEKGNLKVEVYFYPSRPAETIVIVVGQQKSGASVSEA